MTRTLMISSLLFAGACIPTEGVPAPFDAELNIPSDLTLAPSAGFFEAGDGLATVAILDISITDPGNSDSPLSNIRVEAFSGWSGVYLFPDSAISVTARPDDPDVSCDEEWNPSLCPWQDPDSQNYYNLANDYGAGDDDAYRPDYVIGQTDSRGIFRIWTFIDQMPYTIGEIDSGGQVGPDDINWNDAGVSVSIGHAAGSVTISVQDAGGGG